jgi:hypothetical protein
MRIDSSGNVGIGTNSPESTLHVKGTSDLLAPIVVQGLSNSGVNLFSNRVTNGVSYINIGMQYSSSGLLLGSFIKPSNTSSSDATGYLSSYGASSVKRAVININGADGTIRFLNTDTSATVAVDTAVAMTERMRITSDGNLQFNSGYGSVATAFGCRAWVNFNGIGTPAIRGSGNVSSITDNGTGNYTVNFTTAMPDANSAGIASASTDGIASNGLAQTETNTTTCSVACINTVGSVFDPLQVDVAVFR